MESLYILLPLSLLLVVLIIAILWWSISSGQYDSLDRASIEILMDQDHEPRAEPSATVPHHDGPGQARASDSASTHSSQP